jgi:hypothetical protein
MPFKARYFYNRRSKTPKAQPKRDWSDYNKKMKMRGDITIWLSPDVIEQWHVADQNYDGNGAPLLFSNMAIMTVHEIRQIFKLPLRQCEGFVNALFKMMNVDLRSPSFSTLSKRLKTLGLKQPVYRLAHRNGCDIKMIAIDSSGLKCYGQDEWVREKYGEISEKRNWRKLHVSVDQYNIIQTSELTIRNTHDASVIDALIAPMPNKVKQVTADTAYDSNHVYHLLDKQFSRVDIVIPPRNNATDEKHHHWMRNRNLREIKCYGRMKWQSDRDYGKRNQAERAIGRYKRILGNRLHSREFIRQQQEAIIGCSILNKMTCISLAEIRSKF